MPNLFSSRKNSTTIKNITAVFDEIIQKLSNAEDGINSLSVQSSQWKVYKINFVLSDLMICIGDMIPPKDGAILDRRMLRYRQKFATDKPGLCLSCLPFLQSFSQHYYADLHNLVNVELRLHWRDKVYLGDSLKSYIKGQIKDDNSTSSQLYRLIADYVMYARDEGVSWAYHANERIKHFYVAAASESDLQDEVGVEEVSAVAAGAEAIQTQQRLNDELPKSNKPIPPKKPKWLEKFAYQKLNIHKRSVLMSYTELWDWQYLEENDIEMDAEIIDSVLLRVRQISNTQGIILSGESALFRHAYNDFINAINGSNDVSNYEKLKDCCAKIDILRHPRVLSTSQKIRDCLYDPLAHCLEPLNTFFYDQLEEGYLDEKNNLLFGGEPQTNVAVSANALSFGISGRPSY